MPATYPDSSIGYTSQGGQSSLQSQSLLSDDVSDGSARDPSFGRSKPKKNPTPGNVYGDGPVVPFKEGPVKVACLTCRSKKAKCDGVQPVCGTCSKKDLECQYVKSRRGGARKKREVPPPSALQSFLKRLDGLVGISDPYIARAVREPTDDDTNIVRQFSSRDEIFRCYYNEVHPFQSMMPPRKYLDEILPTLLPESPFLLAVQTILVLVPHAQDPEPKSSDSKRLRSAASHALAQQAVELVERLVQNGQTSLECVQAMSMLSMWEWGSLGSINGNKSKSSRATQLAMDIGLHDMDKYDRAPSNNALEGQDWRKDMARRTWWVTYANQLMSSMVTGTAPIVSPDDERVQVDYPVHSFADDSWKRWIEVNRQGARIFGVITPVYFSHLTPGATRSGDASEEVQAQMRKDMFDLDAKITEMIQEAEKTAVIELVPGGEEEVVRNQQLSVRLGLAVIHIHVHRYQAFPEVSLFSKMICGLPKMPDVPHSSTPVPLMDVDADDYTVASYTGNPSSGDPSPGDPSSGSGSASSEYQDGTFDFIEDMWQPESFPESLPEPWFAHSGGAGALWTPISTVPDLQVPLSATIVNYNSPPPGAPVPESTSMNAPPQSTISTSSAKPHKAWGVDANDKPEPEPTPSESGAIQVFPPGVSLARCATAAHTIVRLEVLHRSATIAMRDGPPKSLPFCACGLVTGAYSFLLLALAVQAESAYRIPTGEALEQIDGLLTNVKVILAGLETYGTMWAGIEVMAGEVRAALEAATQLPHEIRRQMAANQVAEMSRAAYIEAVPSAKGDFDTSNQFDHQVYTNNGDVGGVGIAATEQSRGRWNGTGWTG